VKHWCLPRSTTASAGVGITPSQEEAERARVALRRPADRDPRAGYVRIIAARRRSTGAGRSACSNASARKTIAAISRPCAACLAPDALMLLQSIGSNRSVNRLEPWMEKYVQPGSLIPTAMQSTKRTRDLFVMEDWQNFGADYDRTLMAWRANLERGWPVLREKYDDRFYRMWRFYLSAAAATFRCRRNQMWQIVFSTNGLPHGYSSVR
jgi:cyclopropane-fatty-acyl-phospholipid synthase